MKAPKFSIIIPIYNAEKFLHRCIDSILIQKVPDFELILVNDGSVDNSGEICDNYAKQDSRIKVFHKKNEGVSVARNLGLENAQGEWILFVDADDWVASDYLETINENIEENKDADLFTFAYNQIENDAFLEIGGLRQKNTLNRDGYIRSGYTPFGCLYVYKAAIIKKHGITFPVGVKLSEDQCFIFKHLALCSKIVIIDKVLYNYYEHINSARMKPAERYSALYSLDAANDFLEFAFSHNVSTDYQLLAVYRLYDEFFKKHHNLKFKRIDYFYIQKEYRKAYKKTIQLLPDFKKNRLFRLGYYNVCFIAWIIYKKRNAK